MPHHAGDLTFFLDHNQRLRVFAGFSGVKKRCLSVYVTSVKGSHRYALLYALEPVKSIMQVQPVNLSNGNVPSEVPQAGQPMFPVPTIPVPAVAHGSQGDVVDLHAHLLSQLGRPQQAPQAQMAPFSVGQPQQQIVTTASEQQVVSYDNAGQLHAALMDSRADLTPQLLPSTCGQISVRACSR